MQEEATACNVEKLAALSTITKLDRQICEAQDSMTKLLAACVRCCSSDLQALRAEHSCLKVCKIHLHALARALVQSPQLCSCHSGSVRWKRQRHKVKQVRSRPCLCW